jgi:hypothetical protein
MAQKNYRTKTNIGGHPTGAIITKEDVSNTFGASVDDWLKIGAIEETDDEPTPFTDVQQSMTDAALKDRIENAIREETGKKGRALTVAEQNEVSGRLVSANADRLAQRNQEQVDANAADQRSTRRSGGGEEEPTFHGKPLSAYDKYADAAALQKIDGIGEKTADDILAARAKRDKAPK